MGIDAGGTKTTAVMYDEFDNVVNSIKVGPGNFRIDKKEAISNIQESINRLIQTMPVKENLKGIAVGVAGISNNEIDELKLKLEKIYKMRVVVTSDYDLAYKAAFKNKPGIIVISGTGLVLYGKNEKNSKKIGGWGHILGDEGSGYELVVRMFKKAILTNENDQPIPLITNKILKKLNISELEEIKPFIYGNHKNEIARFAEDIFIEAEKGDLFSIELLEETASIIVEKLKIMKETMSPDAPIEYTLKGGILEGSSLVKNSIFKKTASLDEGFKFINPRESNKAARYFIQADENSFKYAVGLMSGTSLDGIDVVLCEINNSDLDTNLRQVDFETFDYPKETLANLRTLLDQNNTTLRDISTLNVDLGYAYADSVKKICYKNKISLEKLAFVASHGQTVFHDATGNKEMNRSTLQLGEPSIIAFETNTLVVSNFRSKDMAAGGEGAPLVPLTEWILYQDQHDKVLLNIGGIGNLTYLPSDGDKSKMVGFDTGPGNMMINEGMSHLLKKDYDNKGEVASKGQLIIPMLEELMNHWFIKKTIPKSTGRDEFGKEYTLEIIKKYKDEKIEDVIYTFTLFTVKSIVKGIKDILKTGRTIDRLLIAGGGIHNITLMQNLKEQINDMGIEVYKQEELGYSSDAKEAIAFVILANQTLSDKPGNVPSVTGANKTVKLGSVTYPE